MSSERAHKYSRFGRILAIAVSWTASACSAADNTAASCGTPEVATASFTVTQGNPTFNLVTPSNALSGSASCLTEFDLNFEYANPARARTDATQPPLLDLAEAFRPDPTDHFVYSGPMEVVVLPPYLWDATTSNHPGNGTTTTTYSIVTGFNSTNPSDSVIVTGRITYYTAPH